jgi:hypothetical protein
MSDQQNVFTAFIRYLKRFPYGAVRLATVGVYAFLAADYIIIPSLRDWLPPGQIQAPAALAEGGMAEIGVLAAFFVGSRLLMIMTRFIGQKRGWIP